jgi:glucose/arabinose dehydrogenase
MQLNRWWTAAVPLVLTAMVAGTAAAQEVPAGPSVVDPDLQVRTVASGLAQPTSAAFLGDDDVLVLEKATGKVKRLQLSSSGAPTVTEVLDLPVNSASERGLLGIAVHPQFPRRPFVYLYWTESTSGQDSTALPDVPLLGNRVDRFQWNGTTLTRERPIVALRARQNDPSNVGADGAPIERGNHNGGKIVFGTDGKLYIEVGDVGRRGQMQNLPDGPGCTALPCPEPPTGGLTDDQYGGPEPDDAHLTGVVLRLNADGSTPGDNPFVRAGRERGGEVGRNLAKVFSYGVRNAFGLAVDPLSGALWDAQNGDDAFSEINRIPAGSNLGWIQAMGPISRNGQFKEIETDRTTRDRITNQLGYFGLQQTRYSPERLAGDPREALARMFDVSVGVNRFTATLTGRSEVPSNTSGATGSATFRVRPDGSIDYTLDVEQISNVRAAHIHLGAAGQNGPVVVPLFDRPEGVSAFDRERIASGQISAAQIVARTGFAGTPAELLQRMRQGRAYVNVHTTRFPGGEIRGEVEPANGTVLSRYQDPALSWTYEVAPIGLGFVADDSLGAQYRGDMLVGAARNLIEGGQLFRIPLSRNRAQLAPTDPRLADRVADNTAKYDITESESLLFGSNFGVATDIRTGPDGNVYVLSLSNGSLYEISRR